MNHPTSSQARQLPQWIIILAFVILLGFLGLLYAGLNRAQQGPIIIGQIVPPIHLTLFDGQVISTTNLAGKVILINFWASWCTECETEAADLETAWKYYQPGEQVAFLGVDYVDTEPKARIYLQKFNISYTNGPDLRTTISQMFRITGVPETYILDRDGKLAYKKIGPFASVEEIKTVIDGLLK